MTVDSIWLMLGKKLSGEASPEELEALEKMLHHHPDLHYPIQNITDLWRLKKPVDQTEALASLQEHLLRLGETGAPVQLYPDSAYPETNLFRKRGHSIKFSSLQHSSHGAFLYSILSYLFSGIKILTQPSAKRN